MSTLRTCRTRFTRPVFLWAVAALASELAIESLPIHGLPLLLPLIPALLFLLALVQAVRKMDELQKRICLDSAFIAFILTLAVTFVFSSLQRAGIYHAPGNDIGTLMMFFWACAYGFSAWRYR